MSKNLILIYPPKKEFSTFPESDVSLALLYLAGSARDSGICDNISIFDFNAPFGSGKNLDDLITVMEKQPEGKTVVGINCLHSALFPSVRETAKAIKERFPHVMVITGGMHPTLFAKEIIDNCPEIDTVAIGESDLDFPKLLRYFYGEGSIEDVEGVCLRIEGETVLKPRLHYIHDLDALPRPGYEFFDFREYEMDTSKFWNPDGKRISKVQLPLLTSRSCPNKCNFCSMKSVMGDKFRARSAENVFEEIKYLYDTFNVNYFIIMDDNLTLNRDRIIKICKMIIESGMEVQFEAFSGLFIKTLDKEVVSHMRQAGFVKASLAVESGSDYVRNEIMGKHVTREHIINTVTMCAAEGMRVSVFLINGMPEDTEETLKATVDLIRKLDAVELDISIAKPLAGTKLFEQCVRDNLMISGLDAETLWMGEAVKNVFPEVEFTDSNADIISPRQFFIKPYNLSIERLTEIDLEIQLIGRLGFNFRHIYGYSNKTEQSGKVIYVPKHFGIPDTSQDYRLYLKRYTDMLIGIEGKQILLFGSGGNLQIWLERYGLRDQVVCVFDNNAAKWNNEAYGVVVKTPSMLPEMVDENTRVIITSVYYLEIGEQLESMGISDYYVFIDGWRYYTDVKNLAKRN